MIFATSKSIGRLAVVGGLLAVAACSTSPITLAEAAQGQRFAFAEPRPGTAMVTVIRDAGIQSGACPTEISVDGRPAGSLWASQAIQLHIPAGEVILGARSGCFAGLVEREARLAAGQRVTYRVAHDQNGSLQFGRSLQR